MKIEIQEVSGKEYKVYDGTFYHVETKDKIIERLEQCRRAGQSVRVFLGDTETGKAWAEENDVYGRLGRSTGPVKIPLLCHPRSRGGGGLLTHCIVAICTRDYRGQMIWPYRHPKLDLGQWTYTSEDVIKGVDVPAQAVLNGSVHASFKTMEQALRYIDFMTGKRLVT